MLLRDIIQWVTFMAGSNMDLHKWPDSTDTLLTLPVPCTYISLPGFCLHIYCTVTTALGPLGCTPSTTSCLCVCVCVCVCTRITNAKVYNTNSIIYGSVVEVSYCSIRASRPCQKIDSIDNVTISVSPRCFCLPSLC